MNDVVSIEETEDGWNVVLWTIDGENQTILANFIGADSTVYAKAVETRDHFADVLSGWIN